MKCIKCGHEPCPICQDWCDELIYDEEGDMDLCCDGKCTYVDSNDVKKRIQFHEL